jgi:hypothetical protein
MEEICEAIGFAFRIQELNNKTITNKPVNLRDADLPIHCSTTPFISPSVLDVVMFWNTNLPILIKFVTQSDIEKSSDKSNNSVSRRNAEKNEPENSYRRETRSKSPNLPGSF